MNIAQQRAVFDGMTFAALELRDVLDAGPYKGEDFYRLKVTGNGETRWLNISPAELTSLIAITNGRTEQS